MRPSFCFAAALLTFVLSGALGCGATAGGTTAGPTGSGSGSTAAGSSAGTTPAGHTGSLTLVDMTTPPDDAGVELAITSASDAGC
jgi:hypothetical protein